MLDLASHDVSIYNFLLDATPTQVSAVGKSFLQPGIQDVSVITLQYPNDVIGSIHVSWLDPKKVRDITVVGDRRMAIWDDLATLGPVMVFDKGVTKKPREYANFGEFQLLAREGDVTVPRVPPAGAAEGAGAGVHRGARGRRTRSAAAAASARTW